MSTKAPSAMKQKAQKRAAKAQSVQPYQTQSGKPRGDVVAVSRLDSVLSKLASDPAKAYFGYLRGLVSPLLSGPIPDLTSQPTAHNVFSNQGQIVTTAGPPGGGWQGRVIPRITDMFYQDSGGAVTWGVAGVTAGYRAFPQAAAYRGLIEACRCTGMVVRIKPVSSALNNSGMIAIGQVPTTAAAPYTIAQITQLPAHVTCTVPELAQKGSLELWVPTDSLVSNTGTLFDFLHFQGNNVPVNGAEPGVVIAIEGAVANAAAFIVEVEAGFESVTTNQILTIKAAAPHNDVAMGMSSLASSPAFVKAVSRPEAKESFIAAPAKFLWDHRGDIAGAGKAVFDVAKNIAPYALPALSAMAALL